ncbi:MAG: ribosome maturation factor RimM [Spiroplasma sp.]
MQYLEIAKVITTHGLLGEVKVLCNYYGKHFNNWKPKQVVYLKNHDDYQLLIIKKVRIHKNFLLVTFENYHKIDLVLFMKNKSLGIFNENTDDKINEKNDSNFSFENLIGYQVINSDNNEILGTIIVLIDNNHSGLWQVDNSQGKSFYVPNNQFFIVKIDKNKKRVYLNLISGMFNYE